MRAGRGNGIGPDRVWESIPRPEAGRAWSTTACPASNIAGRGDGRCWPRTAGATPTIETPRGQRWHSSLQQHRPCPPPSNAPETPGITTRIDDLDACRSIATLTISNPRKLNIVNAVLLESLTSQLRRLAEHETLRAAVLTGGPPAPGKAASFIGGMDITEMSLLASPAAAKALIRTIHAACAAIRDLPVPVIAKVDGYCLGAGLEIAAACDLRIATRRSVFGMPEVRIGIPSVIEAALLPGLVGMGRARRLVYLAESIDAVTAERWGLVEEVVETAEELEGKVGQWAEGIAGMGGRAMRSQKRLCRVWEEEGVEEGILAGVEAFGAAFEGSAGEEARRLMGEFVGRKR